MQYVEYPLTNLGIKVVDGKETHQGWSFDGVAPGYPTGSVACYDNSPKTKTLAVFLESTSIPSGGTAVAKSDVTPLLRSQYGWPVGTTLNVNGLPADPTVI